MSMNVTAYAYARLPMPTLSIQKLSDAITEVELEGIARHDDPEFGRRIIDLTEAGSCAAMSLNVEAAVDNDAYGRVLQPNESDTSNAIGLVTVSSGSTKTRFATKLVRTAAGRYSGNITLHRPDWGGSVEIGMRVVRSTDFIGVTTPGRAHESGMILGEADPILLVFEKTELPYTGQVRFVWKDFASEEDADLKNNAELPLVVRTEQAPTVIMNSGIPNLKAAIESRSNSSATTAVREALIATIGGSVWRQLIAACILAVQRNDDTSSGDDGGFAVTIPADWKGSVVRAFGAWCHPNLDAQDAAERLFVDVRDPDASQILFARIGMFADRQAKTRRSIDNAIRAAQRAEAN
jgi:hypothetical protein